MSTASSWISASAQGKHRKLLSRAALFPISRRIGSRGRRCMTANVDDLRRTLCGATDGGVACDAINELSKHAQKGYAADKPLFRRPAESARGAFHDTARCEGSA